MGRILSVLFFIFPFLKDGLYHYFDMCYFCYTLPVELRHEVKCTIAGHVGEEVSVCNGCGNQFDYFSYGSTERGYHQGIFESEYPKLSTLLNKIAEFVNHAGTLYNRG